MKGQLLAKTARVGGCRVHYREGGQPAADRVPLLILHGWGASSEAYAPVLAALSVERRVIAPDLPGFGRSSHPVASWGYRDYADCIRDFAESLALRDFHLLGHSMGGGISIALAAACPEAVRSLVLVDSAGIPLGSLGRLVAQRALELPAQALAARFASVSAVMLKCFLHNALFNTRNVWATLRLPLEEDLRPLLPRIQAPCLLLWGTDDRTIPLACGQELAQGISAATLTAVDKAYHEWGQLRPQELASMVSAFIRYEEEDRSVR